MSFLYPIGITTKLFNFIKVNQSGIVLAFFNPRISTNMPGNNSLRGIEDIKLSLQSDNVKQKIAALFKALEYGEEGLNLVIQSLNDDLWQVQHAAFMLLRQRSLRSTPQVKKSLRQYITIDGQYPDERQEIKRFLSDSSWITQNGYGSRVPLPELLRFMKWGEVLVDDANATGYRFEGIIFYIKVMISLFILKKIAL